METPPKVAESVLKAQEEMLHDVDKFLLLLDEAQKGGAREAGIIKEELPGLQRSFIDDFQHLEKAEEALFREETPVFWISLKNQQGDIELICKVASALITAKDPAHLYGLRMAMNQIRRSLREHYAYEERHLSAYIHGGCGEKPENPQKGSLN